MDAACLASTLHYNLLNKQLNLEYDLEEEGNTNFISNVNKNFKNFGNESLEQIKKNLKKQKINIRI